MGEHWQLEWKQHRKSRYTAAGSQSCHECLLLIMTSIITVNTVTLSASVSALLRGGGEGAACDIIALSLPLKLTSLRCSTCDVIRGSVKEELGERERPTDIRWMLGNAVCYSRDRNPHSGEESMSQRLRTASTHTHTHVRGHAVLKQATH